MNRIVTALALSGLFIAAPAFAKTSSSKTVAVAGDKASAGSTDGKSDSAAPADAAAKPVKHSKKMKKTTTETKTEAAAPVDAPAK